MFPPFLSPRAVRCDQIRPGRANTTKLPLYIVGARIDTDHVVGTGQVSITGRYDSKKDSFGIDTAFAADDNNTIYGSYTVTDERLSSIGLETGFDVKKNRVTVDTTYFPPTEGARCKALVRQGKIKVAGTWTAGSVKSIAADTIKAVKLDFETKLSTMETLKLAFDTKSKAAKIKYARKLDTQNKVDVEYSYAGPTASGNAKNVTLKLAHAYSPKHLFSAAFNYGSKKIMTEWEWKTDNGPWTVNATFPFNASPKSGDVAIKRRFDF